MRKINKIFFCINFCISTQTLQFLEWVIKGELFLAMHSKSLLGQFSTSYQQGPYWLATLTHNLGKNEPIWIIFANPDI